MLAAHQQIHNNIFRAFLLSRKNLKALAPGSAPQLTTYFKLTDLNVAHIVSPTPVATSSVYKVSAMSAS